MEILSPEIHVLELDGFLNALRCIIGHPSRIFGAGLINKNGITLEAIVEEQISKIKQSGKFIARSTVDFNFIQNLFNERIYSLLPPSKPENIKNLDWNLVEYYGLISTAEDEGGPWNRLVSQNCIHLEFFDEQNHNSAIFFVEHDEFVIATYL
jgi:hypothetical protein